MNDEPPAVLTATSSEQPVAPAQAEIQPQFRSRRAFIVWAISAGLCSERRLTEAVLREVESAEATR